tara:strand:+ start:5048 stop:5239 length:192 start_codon:yes stop_codon:yes gene_type:complete
MDPETFVEKVVIDVCSKRFKLYSDQGEVRHVNCETSKQFMDVLEVVTDQADPGIIEYAEITVN